MSKKKKLTRKEKIQLSKDNICWKCNGQIEFNKEIRALKCDDCGLIIDVKDRVKL
jgi:DNA-directed RNA polymerase subunit RPC12/RpoP